MSVFFLVFIIVIIFITISFKLQSSQIIKQAFERPHQTRWSLQGHLNGRQRASHRGAETHDWQTSDQHRRWASRGSCSLTLSGCGSLYMLHTGYRSRHCLMEKVSNILWSFNIFSITVSFHTEFSKYKLSYEDKFIIFLFCFNYALSLISNSSQFKSASKMRKILNKTKQNNIFFKDSF